MQTLIAGNWKMNGTKSSLEEIDQIVRGLDTATTETVEALICPPVIWLTDCVARCAGSSLKIGAQDCHEAEKGAHTGDISASMLHEAGASHVIIGHSERRQDHFETDPLIARKAKAAFTAGLIPIICIGESLKDRQAGKANTVVLSQLAASLPQMAPDAPFIIAYEPIWAIGTGLTPTLFEIQDMHAGIRAALSAQYGQRGAHIPLLYGGSMKPDNAADILGLEDINGGLIGGASLKARDFLAIYAEAA